jgi:membrane protease subunit HflK
MERLFGGTDKIIVDTNKNAGGSGVVPYLPLNELRPQMQTPQTRSTK